MTFYMRTVKNNTRNDGDVASIYQLVVCRAGIEFYRIFVTGEQ